MLLVIVYRFYCHINNQFSLQITLILLSPEEIAVAATAPPPPPPPPVMAPPKPPKPSESSEEPSPEPIKRNMSRQSIASAHSSVQEELTSVLTLVRERGKQKFLDIKQTPETFIDQRSNAAEVQDWLEKKGFSDTIRKRFQGIGGYEILGMHKQELEKCCGKNEGWRLYSQLNIQKSCSGVSINIFETHKILTLVDRL